MNFLVRLSALKISRLSLALYTLNYLLCLEFPYNIARGSASRLKPSLGNLMRTLEALASPKFAKLSPTNRAFEKALRAEDPKSQTSQTGL
ncbi:hypothetical protein C8R41DRAFT_848563 [Lentinula lateritia]|uniref:Uncharacterized protein n=1 Tax=Lentinula lateritia TaxID=40482 RepID=A0ABQ8V7L4_9AGAR|nr:hypothetical protein C8R41DRAFT_848563 [Lentinula lateritia]